jgi:hypothetical protein
MALRDPFYSAAAKHFDSLFRAYGRSCIVLNLIKVRCLRTLHRITLEQRALRLWKQHEDDRESTLLDEFKDCIDYLNQALPEKSKIDYIAYDLSSAKARWVRTWNIFPDWILTLYLICRSAARTTNSMSSKTAPRERSKRRDSSTLVRRLRVVANAKGTSPHTR